MWQAPKRLAGSSLRDGLLSLLLWIWLTLLLLPMCAAVKLPNSTSFVWYAGVLFAVAWLIPFRSLQAAAALLVMAFTAHNSFFAHESFWSGAWLLGLLHLLQSGKFTFVYGQLQDVPNVSMALFMVLWGAVYLYRQAAIDRIVLFALWVFGLLAIGIEDSFTRADGHLYLIGYFVTGLILLALCQVPYLEKAARLGHRRAFWPLSFVLGTVAIAICTSAAGIAAPKLRSQWPDPVPFLKSYAASSTQGTPALKKIGYTSDDALLGGSFSADNAVAMVAISNQKGYWRGETRTLYTGKGWTVSADALPVQANSNGETSLNDFSQLNLLAGVGNPGVKVKQVVQSVSIEAGSPSVFFSQYQLAGLTLTGATAGSTLSDHQLFWSKRSDYVRSDIVKSGSTYTAISTVPYVDPAQFNQLFATDPHYHAAALQTLNSMGSSLFTGPPLADNGINIVDPFLAAFSSELQLPGSFPKRDRELAASLVAGQTTDYDKAAAIQNYLRTHYAYETKQIPTPGPQDDFVDQFLFESKKGYCDHFSSAMVLLARSVGLPARWVTGYATGTIDPSYQDPADSHNMRFLVHNSDAHAWAEVYLRGVGWIPFEATPSFTMPQPQEDSAPLSSPLPTPLPPVAPPSPPNQPASVPAAQLPQGSSTAVWDRSVLGWGAASLLALGLLLVLLLRRRRMLSDEQRLAQGSPEQVIIGLMDRLMNVLKRCGVKLDRHQTIREYLPHAATRLDKDWVEFARLFEQARYGRPTIHEQDAHTARELFRRILENLLSSRKKR